VWIKYLYRPSLGWYQLIPQLKGKNRNFGRASFIFTYFSHLNTQINIVSKYISNWKAFPPAVNAPVIFLVIITLVQVKVTLNTPTFYYSDKTKVQLLGSRLKQWNCLENGVIISFYINRQSELSDGVLAYWNNIQELMENNNFNTTLAKGGFALRHLRSVWRQCYFTMEISSLLSYRLKRRYEEQRWNISADLDSTAMLTVLQGGYTEFCCLWCEWDSRARHCHCRIKIMATPFRNSTRSEECGKSCFKG
jgi:hypothetical protein